MEKKMKTFNTPNRFAVLSTADGDTEPDVFPSNDNIVECKQLPPIKKVPESNRVPPINLKKVSNFSEFRQKLIQLTYINNFSCKSTP